MLCQSRLPLVRERPFTLWRHELSQLVTFHHLLNPFYMYSSEFKLRAKRLKQKKKKRHFRLSESFSALSSVTLDKVM